MISTGKGVEGKGSQQGKGGKHLREEKGEDLRKEKALGGKGERIETQEDLRGGKISGGERP